MVGGARSVAQRRPDAPPVRFHHLHYQVDDPGAALAPTADRLKGTRVLLQGLGVGVRVGQEYVLFDRSSESRPRMTPEAAYVEAFDWLTARRFTVRPHALSETGIAAGLPDATFGHLAFAVDDLTVARAALKEKPISATDDVARFRLPSGSIVEIVRDTDRPDTYWCPMHPDVRRPGAAKCPRCGMALVPIPPPRLGEYRLDVALLPRSGGGASGLRIVVRDPESGAAVTTFTDVHERAFHLFIVSRDLETFAHVHPQRTRGGAFELRHDLAPGQYFLIADFLPAGATPQLVQRVFVTPGYSGPLFGPPPSLNQRATEQVVSGLRIRLDASQLRPGRASPLRVEIADSRTGTPVTDLELYLGAPGHLLIVSADGTAAIHGHPDDVPGLVNRGPIVTFDPVLPASGTYKLWVQFQRKGEVVTAPFVIRVP